MNKNLIMIVGALCVVLLIVFWVQYSVVKSLQNAQTMPGVPDATAPAGNVPAGTAAAPGAAATPATTVTKKTTISAPVHKKH